MNAAEILLLLSTLSFVAAFVVAALGVRSGKYRPTPVVLALMALGFLLQTGFLYIQGQLHGRCPITTGLEVMVFIAWSMVLIYLLVGPTYRLSLLGAFTSPLVAIFQSVALLGGIGRAEANPAKNGIVDPWVELHASLALVAYGAFALACVAGIMYLVQERLLKRHKIGGLFYNLPPISALATATWRLVLFGFVLLTIGICCAFAMHVFPPIGKLASITFVWIAYGGILLLNLVRRMPPRRAATAAVAAFVFPVVSLALLH